MVSSPTADPIPFGFYPVPLSFTAAGLTVESLPDLQSKAESLRCSAGVEGNWIHAPAGSRVFGLPRTHTIQHENWHSADHLTFHLWALSFFTGMRLTATEAGFLDATPLQPGKLVDFYVSYRDIPTLIDISELFWRLNIINLKYSKLIGASIHALFLSQRPNLLQFERFSLLYQALDACYRLTFLTKPPSPKRDLRHDERIEWMCRSLGIFPPTWALKTGQNHPEIANIRNSFVHEALFDG